MLESRASAEPRQFREAWLVAAALYPELGNDDRAYVWFETDKVGIETMRSVDKSDSPHFARMFWLHVHRARAKTPTTGAPLLEANIIVDGDGRIRSFVVADCEIHDAIGLEEMSKELVRQRAGVEEVERRLRARFAVYPPGRSQEAAAEFRARLGALRDIVGSIQVNAVRFGSSGHKPEDVAFDLLWRVEGTLEGRRVTAAFEPIAGRLVSLSLFD
jgi:hypothetical protein